MEKEKNELLDKLLKQRESFLKENPHLVEYQNEIDRLLDGAGSTENRLETISIMLQTKLVELQNNLKELGNMLDK